MIKEELTDKNSSDLTVRHNRWSRTNNKVKGKKKVKKEKFAVKEGRIVGVGRERIHSIVGRTVVALDRNMLGVDGGGR